MKPNLIILLILISILCGCKKTNEVNIFGKISGQIPDKITYSVPVNGVSYFGFTESVVPDSLGNFQIKILTKEASIIILTVPGIDSKVIVVEPGQNFNISVNTEIKAQAFKISGANEAGQKFYNTLPNPIFVQLGKEVRTIAKYPSQDSIKMKISTLKANEVSELREFLDNREITKSFFSLIAVDRDCYYATMTTIVQYIKYLTNLSRISPNDHYEFPPDMKKVWGDTYLEYPPDQTKLMRSRYWFEYAQTYLIFKEYLLEDFKVQNLIDLREKGLEHTHNIEEAKKYFSGQALEYYIAVYIYFQCLNEEFEKEFIKIFDQFKTDFPDSKYIKYLEPLISPIIDFHKIADTDFDNNIRFIDNYDKIGSLSEALKSLKGERIYVDVWATWCEPCKSEFKNRDSLIQLLKSKGIEILYISIDNDKRDKLWKDMIKYYNLQGYHIRVGNQLQADLTRIFSQNHKGPFYIPYHILVDENGNIIKNGIESPTEIEEFNKLMK